MAQKAHFEETVVVTRYNFCTFIFCKSIEWVYDDLDSFI